MRLANSEPPATGGIPATGSFARQEITLAGAGGAGGTGSVSLAIMTPTANQAVTVHMSDATGGTDLPVAFTVQNFALKVAGMCGSVSNTCGHAHVFIDGDKCTECVGHFEESQCVDVCPVDCIIIDLDRMESHEQLQEKYVRLMAAPG